MNLIHDRRRFLKGLALGASAPVLGPLMAQLRAATEHSIKPKRFVFVVQGNGILPHTIVPEGVNRPVKMLAHKKITDAPVFREVPLKGLALSSDFETLKPYQERLTILMGLSGRACQGGHSNNYGALGVYGSGSGAAGETIDCALARALPAPFAHVSLGITRRTDEALAYNISAWGRGQAVGMQCRPLDALHSLFGSVLPSGAADFATLPNVLDTMSEDLQRLEKQLSGHEREKLQVYAQALGEMQKRQNAIRAKDQLLRKYLPEITPKFRSDTETDRLEAHVEIGAAALIAGLTNTLVLGSGNGNSYFEVTYKGLGMTVDMHTIGHGTGADGKTAEELARIIRRFHLGMMVRLADKLQSIPEGDGTMLDNTCMVFLSDAGDGHHAANWEYPMVILGDLGGALKTRGRYLEYPHYGRAGHRSIASLYCTLLHAAGAPRDKFGILDHEIPAEMQTGPLNELLS
jgi:hypothetical protein